MGFDAAERALGGRAREVSKEQNGKYVRSEEAPAHLAWNKNHSASIAPVMLKVVSGCERRLVWSSEGFTEECEYLFQIKLNVLSIITLK